MALTLLFTTIAYSQITFNETFNEAKHRVEKQFNTQLSTQEEAELRQAVINYKKNRSRVNAEQTINKYANKYPNDKLVKVKLSEKSKFDASK